MMKTTSAPPAKAGISRTGMSKAYDSRRKELKLRMKKWMKICLMAAASAMLLAGCGTKDNTAETTAVETTAKAEDTKETETEKAEETTRAAASETAETTEAADIHVKINEPIQVKQTFLRRVYYHLPVKVQNKVKPIVKNYIKKRAQ